jgi:hypothetical protein
MQQPFPFNQIRSGGSLPHQTPEPVGVDGIPINLEQVTAPIGHQHRAVSASLGQNRSDPRHVGAQRLVHVARRLLAPHKIAQPFHRYHTVSFEEQNPEQTPFPPPRQRQDPAVLGV